MITYLILLVISGLIVGALGRLAIPGPDPMGIGATIMVGIGGGFFGGPGGYRLVPPPGGSFIGGLVGYVLFHRPAGLILSVVGAALIVFLIRKSRGGSLDDPYGRRGRGMYDPRRGRSLFGR